MTKNWFHILLACVVSLTPPGASMVRYSCDLTGATTQIISALGAGNHVDECCTDESAAESLAAAQNECCRATVFSLPPTSPAPTELAAQGTPVLVPFDLLAPDVTVRLAGLCETRASHALSARNLPLLV